MDQVQIDRLYDRLQKQSVALNGLARYMNSLNIINYELIMDVYPLTTKSTKSNEVTDLPWII